MNINEKAAAICRNSRDAEQFWRESVKNLSGFNPKDEGVFLITLDSERHFTGCHQITSKVFRSAILFADEVAASKAMEGLEECIVIHNRPGIVPEAGPDDKARAVEIALAARRKNVSLLDYIIIGVVNDRFPLGMFSPNKQIARWMKGKKP